MSNKNPPILDPVDQKLFDELNEIHGKIKGGLVELLMKEVELEASRGNPDRFRKYRMSVMEWMRDNVNNNGKRRYDDNDEYYKVEFEFMKKKKRKSRTAYPDKPVKIPPQILHAAFLSGSNNRLKQIHARDTKCWDQGIDPTEPPGFEKVLHDSDNVSGVLRGTM